MRHAEKILSSKSAQRCWDMAIVQTDIMPRLISMAVKQTTFVRGMGRINEGAFNNGRDPHQFNNDFIDEMELSINASLPALLSFQSTGHHRLWKRHL